MKPGDLFAEVDCHLSTYQCRCFISLSPRKTHVKSDDTASHVIRPLPWTMSLSRARHMSRIHGKARDK